MGTFHCVSGANTTGGGALALDSSEDYRLWEQFVGICGRPRRQISDRTSLDLLPRPD